MSTTQPPGTGWHYWIDHPPAYELQQQVELWRHSWEGGTMTLTLGDVSNALNVRGLWWRPAGGA